MSSTRTSVKEITRLAPSRSRWLPPLLLLLAVLGVGGWLAYSTWFESTPVATPTVQAATVTQGQLATTFSASGSAYAVLQSKLTFNASGATTVTGLVKTVDVKVGETVTAGQQLATLDSRNVSRALQQAETNLESAQLRLDQLLASLPEDRATVVQSVVSARAQLTKAQNDLVELQKGASNADAASARQAVTTAESNLATTQTSLGDLQRRVQIGGDVQTVQAHIDTTSQQLSAAEQVTRAVTDELGGGGMLLRATLNDLVKAVDLRCRGTGNPAPCLSVAESSSDIAGLAAAIDARASGSGDLTQLARAFNTAAATQSVDFQQAAWHQLQATAMLPGLNAERDALIYNVSNYGTPTSDEMLTAARAREAAAAALTAAQARYQTLIEGATSAELQTSRDAVSTAQANLNTVLARQTASGTNSDVLLQELQVNNAQVALQQAQDAVDDTVLTAPFAGIIGAISISPGDLVGPSTQAFTLTDPTAIGVQLTISETDLPGLAAGQIGIVTFTALSQQAYVIEVVGVSNVPTLTSGVVTYPVQAQILTGDNLRSRRARLEELLSSRAGASLGAANDVDAAIERLSAQSLPTPGMNGTVTVVQQVVKDAILVPTGAVRRQGQQTFVFVRGTDGNPERRVIAIGGSDGTNTIVTSGLAEGETVLIGTVSVTATATASATGTTTSSQGGPPSGGGSSDIPGGVR
ncbi:MAG: HlyD family efflux transporter periplasmic adaptor subunit [Dehalococcoidia bacterium]|nr:HlyD family efflux transporter periplasmic adaptor subunit [Dehalococcoidia bacterium]